MKQILVALSLLLASACASAPVEPEPAPAPSLQLPELAPIVDAWAAEAEFSGVVMVADQGAPVLLQAYDPADLNREVPVGTDTKFAIASMTKSFTALLVLQLAEEGKVSLDDTIADWLPGYAADYAQVVTIRQMLQNRSGIPHYISIPGWFDNDVKRAFTGDSLLSAASQLPLAFEPGADYLYSNVNYYLLGRVIERATGRPYEAVLSERVLAPLGLSQTGQIYEAAPIPGLAANYLRNEDTTFEQIPVVNPALFQATASQYSTASDILIWSEALMGTDLLSDEGKAILLDPDTPMAWTVGAWPTEDGATMPLHTYNGQLIGYTSMLTQFPDRKGTIIILNNNNAGYEALSALTVEIAAQLYGGM